MLPEKLLQSLENLPGFERKAFVQVHDSGELVTSVRLNPAKPVKHYAFDIKDPVPWNVHGYYLSGRPSFTGDPLFHAGAYYVQEASSMFLETVIRQAFDSMEGLKVLDLCAAPGGKSTLIQSLLPNNSLLVSNEVIRTRVNVLIENITKWGASNVVVTNNDAKDFAKLPGFFDAIIVDAPCSGSGLFRKDPDAVSEWSEQNVQLCSERQQRILADVLPSLKEGGVLIYSTCSYSVAEDEAIGEWLTGNFELTGMPVRLSPEWGIVETGSGAGSHGYRFYPDKLKGEGFFISAFRKTGNPADERQVREKSKGMPVHRQGRKDASVMKAASAYLQDPSRFFFFDQQDEWLAIPAELEGWFTQVRSNLYIRKAGVKLGTVIRDELVPSHELAVSTILEKRNGLPVIEVDKETALQYLRRQEFNLAEGKQGWSVLSHEGLPLGWVKILSNRVNNYYPKDWRILNK